MNQSAPEDGEREYNVRTKDKLPPWRRWRDEEDEEKLPNTNVARAPSPSSSSSSSPAPPPPAATRREQVERNFARLQADVCAYSKRDDVVANLEDGPLGASHKRKLAHYTRLNASGHAVEELLFLMESMLRLKDEIMRGLRVRRYDRQANRRPLRCAPTLPTQRRWLSAWSRA